MRKYFLPRTEAAKGSLLKTFIEVLTDPAKALATKYKVDAATIDQLTTGQDWVAWTLANLPLARQNSQSLTSFKNDLFQGSGPLDPPVLVALTKVPTTAPVAGVFVLLGKVAAMIKNAPNYDITDGEALGIEGPEENLPDPATTAPAIEVRAASGGMTEVVWPKGMFDGVKIEVDRGDGWKFLAVDTEPNYIDTFKPAAGQSAIYKYRAIYLLHDAEYGQWSAVVERTVAG